MLQVTVRIPFENCVTREEAAYLRDMLLYFLAQENLVVRLDFSDVRILANTFANVAFGELLGHYSPEALAGRLIFERLPAGGRAAIEVAKQAALRYYGWDESERPS